MKSLTIKIATIAAVAVISTLALTGCSAGTSTPEQAVAHQYETFYNNSTNLDGTKAAVVYKDLKKLPANPSKAQQEKAINELVALAPTALDVVDLDGLTFKEKETLLVEYTFQGVLTTGNYKWSVDDEKVDVEGNKATVAKKAVTVTLDGKETSKAKVKTITFVKNKDGVWKIKADIQD